MQANESRGKTPNQQDAVLEISVHSHSCLGKGVLGRLRKGLFPVALRSSLVTYRIDFLHCPREFAHMSAKELDYFVAVSFCSNG